MISTPIVKSVIALCFLLFSIAVCMRYSTLTSEYFILMGFAAFGILLLGTIGRKRKLFTNFLISEAMLKRAQDKKVILVKRKGIFIADENLFKMIVVSRKNLEKAICDSSAA